MPRLPATDRLTLTRRAVLWGLAGAGCAKRVDLPSFQTFAAYLPLEVAGAVPFEPQALGGQVVLVTFIATWCFPCLAELRVLDRLEQDFHAQGFANVLVGMDLEGRKVLEPFARGYDFTYPLVVADDRLRSGDTPFGRIRELPTRMLFGRDGQPILGYSGVAAFEDLRAAIARALAAK